jgi:HTH-type transcriptional regulator/antitoxin HipB
MPSQPNRRSSVDYAIKTLSQLRPILQGFRKAAGLTQAAMAAHLGVTQQTYAQLEANPTAVSVERLFKVLRILQVDLKLTQAGTAQSAAVEGPEPLARRALSRRAATGTPAAPAANAKRATRAPLKQGASAQKPARAQARPPRAARTSTRETSGSAAAPASRTAAETARSAGAVQKSKAVKPSKATRAARASKKREDW